MFEKDDRAKRVWQCFVCGVQHYTYEEYQKHILEAHDEGREYLSCPTCDAPVRDMRMHFKVKHPNRQLPKDVQLRVGVWFDFKKGRKRRARKPQFREGFFLSEKNHGMELHYRSGIECDVYELLEEDTEVLSFQPEPFKIPYCFRGKWHDYTPDLRVNYLGGQVAVWEIKPSTQTKYPKNKAKWAAMQEYANKLGWHFTVVTEDGIGKLRIKIRDQRLQTR